MTQEVIIINWYVLTSASSFGFRPIASKYWAGAQLTKSKELVQMKMYQSKHIVGCTPYHQIIEKRTKYQLNWRTLLVLTLIYNYLNHMSDTYCIIRFSVTLWKFRPWQQLKRTIIQTVSEKMYTQLLDTSKTPIVPDMFHIGQIKSISCMGSRWMSSSFWYQICRNLLINNKVLIIWIKTGTFWKIANEDIHMYL